MITFYNDYTSYTWVSMLTSKDKAIQAIRHFLFIIENQYHASVKLWMTDTEGEYKLTAFDQILKDRGICILQSASYTPQQNSCMEHLMCTLSDKTECMYFGTCLLESWWNFTFDHTCYVYNQTPQV